MTKKLEERYNPQVLNDYVGQPAAKSMASILIRKNLFTEISGLWVVGASGTGKTALSQAIVRTLLCPNRPIGTIDACGKCEVCLSQKVETIPNVHRCQVSTASEAREQVQNLIEHSTSMPLPITDRVDQHYRILMLDEFQLASKETLSMLLDPLQWCPSNVFWILSSMDPDSLNATVCEALRERCSQMQLKRLSAKDISLRIKECIPNLNEEVANSIGLLSKGNMRAAWSSFTKLDLIAQDTYEGDLSKLSIKDVYGNLAGGASPGKRRVFWFNVYKSDGASVRDTLNEWIRIGNDQIIASLLLEDIINNFNTSNSRIERLLINLSTWQRNPSLYPLSTVFLSNLGVDIGFKPILKSSLEEIMNVIHN